MKPADSKLEEPRNIDLTRFPRVNFCHRPTPIEYLPRISEHLGGPSVFVKRDDCTGLATGGNKTRKLEFLVGDALKQNADMLVTQGAVQSNHVRQTAAAACRFGLECHALLERRVEGMAQSYEQTGNVFFDRLFGATLEFYEGGLDMNTEAMETAERLREQGRRPYFIPGGGSNEVGALGYVSCAREIVEQSAAMDVKFDWLVMATGSTGTQAGLVAGLYAMDYSLPVIGVSVRQQRDKQIKAVHDLAARTLEKIASGALPSGTIIVDDSYVGEGYGTPADSTLEAIDMAAKLEGLLLDPVYSGKGFAGLVGLARENFFKPSDNVLFLHTGGAAALFAYEGTLLQQGKRHDDADSL